MSSPFRLLAAACGALSLCGFLLAAAPASPELNVTPLQQLFIIKELKADIKTVGIVWDKNVGRDDLMPQIQRAAAAAGLKIVISPIADVREIGPTFRDLVRTSGIDALWIVEDDAVVGNAMGRKFLIKSAAEHGLPIFAPSEKWVAEGACVALRKEGSDIQLLVNKAAAQAASVKIPEKYLERTQFLASN
jgi:hypothetical protein